MGLKPDEIYGVTLYDFNMMAKAFNEQIKHEFNLVRTNAYLVSVYSGLEGKARKTLTPEKMLSLPGENNQKRLTQEEVQEIFNRVKKRRGLA